MGSSDVSVYIMEMVHLKVIGSVSISSSLIPIFQFVQPFSACFKFHQKGVEALLKHFKCWLFLFIKMPSSLINQWDAVIFTYIYFLSVNISVNITVSSRLLSGLLLLVSLVQSNVEVYPVITSLVPKDSYTKAVLLLAVKVSITREEAVRLRIGFRRVSELYWIGDITDFTYNIRKLSVEMIATCSRSNQVKIPDCRYIS